MAQVIKTQDVDSALAQQGYYVTRVDPPVDDPVQFVTTVARTLGEFYVPSGCDSASPVIRTSPTRRRTAPPFDRPEAIGWHGDFATHASRPELSIVYIVRGDSRGGISGAWRLASVSRVLDVLSQAEVGRRAFSVLRSEKVPFSYADSEPVQWYHVIEPVAGGRLGLRYYWPSIRRGCVACYGDVPKHIAGALTQLKAAADEIGEIVPTSSGSVLIASNWHSLHDRERQTVTKSGADREALLCFIAQHGNSAPRSASLGKRR
jgi:hypothetical protein